MTGWKKTFGTARTSQRGRASPRRQRICSERRDPSGSSILTRINYYLPMPYSFYFTSNFGLRVRNSERRFIQDTVYERFAFEIERDNLILSNVRDVHLTYQGMGFG